MTPLAIAIASVLATGCSSIGGNDALKSQLDEREAALVAKEQALTEKEQNLLAKEQNLDSQGEKKFEEAPASAGILASDLLPPDAKKGECYARVWESAKYNTVTEEVLVEEEGARIETTPAQYEWQTETLEVSPATSKLVVKPAVYGTEEVTTKVRDERILWRETLSAKSDLVSDEVVTFAQNHSDDDIAGAKPGQCFHEHRTSPMYSTVAEEVLVQEAYDVIETIPAQFRTVEKTVVTKQASSKLVEVPATYKTVEEKILVKPATTVWKKGTGPIQRIDSATGEIMCLVEVPAEYKTIQKRVIDQPATTKVIEIPEQTKVIKVQELVEEAKKVTKTIPAKYKTVNKTVVDSDGELVWHEIHNTTMNMKSRTGRQMCLVQEPAKYKTTTKQVVKVPASTVKVDIPAVYETIKVKMQISEPGKKQIKIPAVYETVSRQELVSEGHMEWRSILCETNMTRSRISQIQQALQNQGYNPGPIDGVVGQQTVSAMNAFQKDNNLPVDKYLNVESIRALGVSEK